MRRCMDLTFHDKFQVKKMYTESHDIRTKYIRGVNSIMNTLPIPKVISYNQFACIELNETLNHMLGHGYELKSLNVNCDSDWKHPDGRYKSEFLKKVRDKVEYQVKNNITHQNTRVCLMKQWSDGFQPYNVIILSLSFLQLFTVTTAHAEKYSTRFTSPFALGYKQSEHGNILCEMLRQSKELENITYRYCKNVGMIPLTVHCQVIQNDYPERCSNTCTLQNGLYSKRWGYFCLFTVKFHHSEII